MGKSSKKKKASSPGGTGGAGGASSVIGPLHDIPGQPGEEQDPEDAPHEEDAAPIDEKEEETSSTECTGTSSVGVHVEALEDDEAVKVHLRLPGAAADGPTSLAGEAASDEGDRSEEITEQVAVVVRAVQVDNSLTPC